MCPRGVRECQCDHRGEQENRRRDRMDPKEPAERQGYPVESPEREIPVARLGLAGRPKSVNHCAVPPSSSQRSMPSVGSCESCIEGPLRRNPLPIGSVSASRRRVRGNMERRRARSWAIQNACNESLRSWDSAASQLLRAIDPASYGRTRTTGTHELRICDSDGGFHAAGSSVIVSRSPPIACSSGSRCIMIISLCHDLAARVEPKGAVEASGSRLPVLLCSPCSRCVNRRNQAGERTRKQDSVPAWGFRSDTLCSDARSPS
jgi:hypothetical protein